MLEFFCEVRHCSVGMALRQARQRDVRGQKGRDRGILSALPVVVPRVILLGG